MLIINDSISGSWAIGERDGSLCESRSSLVPESTSKGTMVYRLSSTIWSLIFQMKKQQRKEEKNGGSSDVKGEGKSDSEDG